jgi:hypothetical protein
MEQELSSLVESPTSIVDLLSTSLPAQATYFIQIIFVTTVFSCGMEILRVVPLLKAMLRRFLGPRLTERERQQPFLTLRPLSNPLDFEHAGFSSNIVSLPVPLFGAQFPSSHKLLSHIPGVILYRLFCIFRDLAADKHRCCILLRVYGFNFLPSICIHLPQPF